MGSHIRTSYTSNMFSLKLVICVCIFFVIGMEAAPKPKPKAKPKPQPKAEPKPYPPIGYPPYFGGHNLPDANPGPWNWNGFPPTRGANPWQLYWNGSPNLNRGNDRLCPIFKVYKGVWINNGILDKGDKFIYACNRSKKKAPDGTKGCVLNDMLSLPGKWQWGECKEGKCVKCKSKRH